MLTQLPPVHNKFKLAHCHGQPFDGTWRPPTLRIAITQTPRLQQVWASNATKLLTPNNYHATYANHCSLLNHRSHSTFKILMHYHNNRFHHHQIIDRCNCQTNDMQYLLIFLQSPTFRKIEDLCTNPIGVASFMASNSCHSAATPKKKKIFSIHTLKFWWNSAKFFWACKKKVAKDTFK